MDLRQQQQLKRKDLLVDALEMRDLKDLVDVPLVTVSDYGVTSFLPTSSPENSMNSFCNLMDMNEEVKLKQQQQVKRKNLLMDALEMEDLQALVDVPLVQINEYGITSFLCASSQEKSAASWKNQDITSPLTPITPNKCYASHDWLPVEVVEVTNQRVESKGTSKSFAPKTVCKNNERWSNESNMCIYTAEVASQVEQIKPHEDVPFRFMETGTTRNGKEDEVASIQTPKKKSEKRKKHRPKVIRDGQQAKKPKLEKPISSKSRESQTSKRVSMTRKKIVNTPSSVAGESTDKWRSKVEESNVSQLSMREIRSVRRSLNFNLDSRDTDEDQLSPMINVEPSVQETFSSITNCCSTKFAKKPSQVFEVAQNESQVGFAINLNCLPDEKLEEYIKLPEQQVISTEAIKGDAVTDDLRKIYDNGFNGINTVQTEVDLVKSDSHSGVIEEITKESGIERDNASIEVTVHPSSYGYSTDRRFMYVYKRKRRFGIVFKRRTKSSRAKNGLGLYMPKICKKRRTIKQRRCNKAVLYGFNDHVFMEWKNSSDIVLAIRPIMKITKKRSKLPTRPRKPTSIETCILEKLDSILSSKSNNGPKTCMEALLADSHYKLKTKKRTTNGRPKLVNSMVPITKKEYGNASFTFRYQQHFVFGSTAATTRRVIQRNHFQVPFAQNHFRFPSDQDYQLFSGIQATRAIVPYIYNIDVIVDKMRRLDINGDLLVNAREQIALSPYGGSTAIVPSKILKKKRSRPKVYLDPETNRVWKLLMGTESVNGDGGSDMDKEKWWEEERKILCGRVDSFIARMHLIQGDRRFSKWKGSVVDSVVGVYLTQNVSDHLSSSAFMSLVARYPLGSRSDNEKSCSESTDMPKEDEDEGISASHDAVAMEERKSMSEADHSGSQGSNNRDNISTSKVESLHVDERDQPLSVEQPQSKTFTSHNLSGSTNLAEAEDKEEVEEVVSSQISTEISTQTVMHFNSTFESFSEAKDRINRSNCYTLDCSTLIMEDSLVQETIMNYESYIDVDEGIVVTENCAYMDAGKETEPSPLLDDSRSSSPSTVTSDNLLNLGKLELKFDPHNPSIMLDNPSSSVPVETGNSYADGDGSCLPSTSFQVIKECDIITADQLGSSTDEKISALDSKMTTVDSHVSVSRQFVELQNCQMNTDTSDRTPLEGVETSEVWQEEINKMGCANSFNKLNVNMEASKAKIPSLEDEDFDVKNQAKVESSTRAKKSKAETTKVNFDWDSLRKEVLAKSSRNERSSDTRDSLDWDAVRCADVNEISEVIRERGMNNVLAARIKDFLNRVFKDHGSIDLEWLRDVPPDKSKDYLLSIQGLGLKSVECVRLLTLQHLAFPVDTNVARVSVRLGWVPLQPLPESLQLHLLEMYPMMEHVQKYLWPRLCKLDQGTLYELHYQMITFGKVFCTKSKPNCNACPMRGDCKHFASAFASARLSLPGPQEKRLVPSRVPVAAQNDIFNNSSLTPQSLIEGNLCRDERINKDLDPIIEEPSTPEHDCSKNLESAIEDDFYEDPDDIPVIKLNVEKFTENVQNYMQENNMEFGDMDMSKALVALSAAAASIPMPKLKNVGRLRTEHRVYELPDSHPLLEMMDRREDNDPCPYLLAIWTPGETAQSNEPPRSCCNSSGSGELCDGKTCFGCNSIREERANTVRGTILIPCRTAMRGSFPLNGTYFQVNEVFADHASSCMPIDVPREWIWNLPRRTVYFGTSVTSIFRGLTTEEIQLCFWRGFICVRGFERSSRAPRPLFGRLHYPLSKDSNTRKMDPNGGQNNTSRAN